MEKRDVPSYVVAYNFLNLKISQFARDTKSVQWNTLLADERMRINNHAISFKKQRRQP